MQTKPQSSATQSQHRKSKPLLHPLSSCGDKDCPSRHLLPSSDHSTQGSEPSPQLECDESLGLVLELDLREDLSVSSSPDFDIPSTPAPEPAWCGSQRQYLCSLLEREVEYTANPFALQLLQPHISPMMRAVLMDWMMEVCSEFTLKRESYYLACNYVDRFLSLRPGCQRAEFQLLGLAAIVIAAKVEEICTPKLTDFAKSADSGFSQDQIKEMERRILRTLSWRLVPPTVFNWMSLAMSLWDDYLLSLAPDLQEAELVLFKQASQPSYRRYRETLQILDAACLDADMLRYSPRMAVAGLLYLMVSKYFYETDYAILPALRAETLLAPDTSLSLCFGAGEDEPLQSHFVQLLFGAFAQRALEIRSVEDIYPTVAFFTPYLEYEAAYDLPVACRLVQRSRLESHYEDFLAYQTHNQGNLAFVSPRLRPQCS